MRLGKEGIVIWEELSKKAAKTSSADIWGECGCANPLVEVPCAPYMSYCLFDPSSDRTVNASETALKASVLTGCSILVRVKRVPASCMPSLCSMICIPLYR